MMDGTWGAGWGPGFGFIFMILFWGLIIFAIVAIVKWLMGTSTSSGATPPPPGTARHILDERYARGEIDKEEYEQKKHDLDA